MSDILIRARGLRRVFSTNGSQVEALRGIDLDIERGETLGVVGVSGSGKSTLLHILGTLDRPTAGEVYYGEENVFDQTDKELADFRNREIGFVFQFHYLLTEFTALENVMMPPLIRGFDEKRAEDVAANILTRVGLGNRLNHRPGQLSGGEQQRVAVARAVVLKPKVVLADEPTGNLDLKTGSSILELFLKLNKEDGTTSVIVTHDQMLADQLERRVRLLDGRVLDED